MRGITQDFTVPAGSGSYATEILYFKKAGNFTTAPKSAGELDYVDEIQAIIKTLTATASVEIDRLHPGTDPATAANWELIVEQYTAAGEHPLVTTVGGQYRMRVKSGGTAGTTVVATNWRPAR